MQEIGHGKKIAIQHRQWQAKSEIFTTDIKREENLKSICRYVLRVKSCLSFTRRMKVIYFWMYDHEQTVVLYIFINANK